MAFFANAGGGGGSVFILGRVDAQHVLLALLGHIIVLVAQHLDIQSLSRAVGPTQTFHVQSHWGKVFQIDRPPQVWLHFCWINPL